MDTWEALQQTPIPELRRRAALVEMVDEFLEPSPPENGLYVWADCTRPYLLGQDFTADTYYQQEIDLMDWMKEQERAERRRRIDAGFAAYGE